MSIPPLDPALVFPVPEDGSEELELLTAGPEMPGHVQPVWPGIYIRNIDGDWVWNEFMDDYWAAMGIFAHEIQEAPWKGAILKATEKMWKELEHIKQFGDFQ